MIAGIRNSRAEKYISATMTFTALLAKTRPRGAVAEP
jgi:hypothetical protein